MSYLGLQPTGFERALWKTRQPRHSEIVGAGPWEGLRGWGGLLAGRRLRVGGVVWRSSLWWAGLRWGGAGAAAGRGSGAGLLCGRGCAWRGSLRLVGLREGRAQPAGTEPVMLRASQ